MLAGYSFFYWDGIKVFFFFYVEFLIEFLVLFVYVFFIKEKQENEVADFVMKGFFFLIFSFFALFAIFWSNPFHGKFFDDLFLLFGDLFSADFWAFLIMTLGAAYQCHKFVKSTDTDKEENALFGDKWLHKILASLPFVALLALIFNGIGFVSPFTLVVIVTLVLGGFQFFWIKYSRQVFSKWKK